MTRGVARRAGPWVGSVVLHLLLVAAIAVAAFRWHSDTPAPQLAIEGSVVRYQDLPPSLKSGKPLREPKPAVPAPVPQPQVETPPEPPKPDPAEAQREQEAAKQREQERVAVEQRKAEEQRIAQEKRVAEETRAAEEKRARDAEAQRLKAAEEKKRAAEAAEARRKADAEKKEQEALAAKQKAEQEQKAREARQRAEREAELKRALASEEEGEAVARSGVVDEYRALLVQTIERNWIKPPSAKAGLECTLYVTQATGGTVIDVKIGECNGDQAVRESIANAVYKSTPLPAPRDPRAFERRLVVVFKPTE